MKTKYFIYKNMKGIIFKKNIANDHILFIPLEKEYYELLIIGQDKHNSSLYYSMLTTKENIEYMDFATSEQKKIMGDKFILVDSVESQCETIGVEDFNIKIANPGSNIKSDIHLLYEKRSLNLWGRMWPVYSLEFNFKPQFDLDMVDNGASLKMVATKLLAKSEILVKSMIGTK